MKKTDIEYLDYTWNPIAMRCEKVSEGCRNCWHLRMADRLKCNPKLSMERRNAYTYSSDPYLISEELDKPLQLKKPARIGVQFMGDLFHHTVPDDYINAVFATMFDSDSLSGAAKHTYFVLTKRPGRLSDFMDKYAVPSDNIWFGVSVEDQASADKRIPLLLQIPVKHRWISAEPLLGPVNLWSAKYKNRDGSFTGAVTSWENCGVNWVVCGSETGPESRPMKWEWAMDIANQCFSADVPFFLKQPYDSIIDNSEGKRREYPNEAK